jgi:hypothetical protein
MFTIAMSLLLAATTPDTTTLPRQPDPVVAAPAAARDGVPTDPLFDREYVATDDSAFILSAVETARQGIAEADSARDVLHDRTLLDVAGKIGEQNGATTRKLEELAKRKGWRLPAANSARGTQLKGTSEARSNADFIVSQLSWHQATVAQYRAQIAGKGDAELKRMLRQALPGYEKNLQLLLAAKP